MPSTHPIVGWATRHAAWILTRFLRHADGQTSYERRWQRPYHSPLCIFGETVMYAEQAKTLPKHATRFNSGIWVGRCTISNTHLVIDGTKLFRTRTVRRFPDGPDRWDAETMQRFSVVVSTPTSIPDVPSRRRDLQERELNEQRNQNPESRPRSSDDPSATEQNRPSTTKQNSSTDEQNIPKRRKRERNAWLERFAQENVDNAQRLFDKDGDAEMLPGNIFDDDELMVEETVETVDTYDPYPIGHEERILQEAYIEPAQISPILKEPKLDAKRAGGLNE